MRPTYNRGDSQAEHQANITAAAISYHDDGSGMVNDTRMPLYPSDLTARSLGIVNPCPPDWGNGTAGSTTYSHFRWANSSIGYKWGKALPAWCLDEKWPDGGFWNGTHGIYPADVAVYGALAGQPVLPGCEPATCKPTYKVSVQAGSIHAQVLPFEFDGWNTTGV